MAIGMSPSIEGELRELRERMGRARDREEFEHYKYIYERIERDYVYGGGAYMPPSISSGPWASLPPMYPVSIGIDPAGPTDAEKKKKKAIEKQKEKSAEFANKPLPEYAEAEPLDKFLAAIDERSAARTPSASARKCLSSEAAHFGWTRPEETA